MSYFTFQIQSRILKLSPSPTTVQKKLKATSKSKNVAKYDFFTIKCPNSFRSTQPQSSADPKFCSVSQLNPSNFKKVRYNPGPLQPNPSPLIISESRDGRTVIFYNPDPVLNFLNSVQVQPV